MTRSASVVRSLRLASCAVLALGALGLAGAGCLDRPVAKATPKVTARVTETAGQTAVDKIDLLIMIDNSSSMADKQNVLKDAVPDLVGRLVTPNCLDAAGKVVGKAHFVNDPVSGKPSAVCDAGAPEFTAIQDIHIGVISSSLGGHGADSCSKAQVQSYDPSMEDMSHLLARGTSVSTYEGKGFLAWDPSAKASPPGEANVDTLNTNFKNMVVGVGQTGCGFEAQLESVYRFLVQPDPYDHVQISRTAGDGTPDPNDPPECGSVPGQLACLVGIDALLLQQRADFLRPDSLVAVVSLTDENDCSVQDGGQYYIVLQASSGANSYHMPRATSVCASDPSNACCHSCRQAPPSGCPDPANDSECQKTNGTYTDADHEEELNLRCFHQRQRFGIDFLYPAQRYVDGMKNSQVPDRTGAMVQNPLFADLQGTGKAARDVSLVFWAGVVGVPWQDIAKTDGNGGPPDLKLGYKSAEDIGKEGIWDVILGTPERFIDPTDPLMIESIEPRQGHSPIVNADLVQPADGSTNSNPVNGHEWDISSRKDDLQYACVFDLPTPKDCGSNSLNCDCADGDSTMNPLCQSGSTYSKMQYKAKGYPGTRHLQVLKGLGSQAIVASICPSNLTDLNATDYGYRPAVGAVIDRLKSALKGQCLQRQLQACHTDPKTGVSNDSCVTGIADGQVPCVVLEARRLNAGEVCDCAATGRSPASPEQITDDVAAAGDCICAITQMPEADIPTCQTSSAPNLDGWCYVDPTQEDDAAARSLQCTIVKANCPSVEHFIRFVGEGQPVKGAKAFITCQEGTFDSTSTGSAGGGVCGAAAP